jgi:Flp pilus assembly protein TadB
VIAQSLAAGGLVGLGALLVARGARPVQLPLASVLARLDRTAPPPATAASGAGESGLMWRLGSTLDGLVGGLGSRSLREDLRVIGRPAEAHMGEKAMLGLLGLLLPQAVVFALAITGAWRAGALIPVWASLGLGAGGFFVPDLEVHARAEERRTSFRYSLGSFLDLVIISLAGGGGVESALHDAAAVGDGWAYGQLQAALAGGRLARTTPWDALARLGEQLGVPELCELAASVGLAGTEGARVRSSLGAKARSLRDHELAAVEAAAESASEKMNLPIAVLFLGFLLFLGYPAVQRILSGI